MQFSLRMGFIVIILLVLVVPLTYIPAKTGNQLGATVPAPSLSSSGTTETASVRVTLEES